MTINLLQNSRLNPKLSVYTFTNGIHNFNTHPLTSPGTELVIHEKPTHHNMWVIHGQDLFYVGLLCKHYQCIRAFIISTGGECIYIYIYIYIYIWYGTIHTRKKYLYQKQLQQTTSYKPHLILCYYLNKPIKLPLLQQNNPDLNDALKTTVELLQQTAAKPKHTLIAPKQNKN